MALKDWKVSKHHARPTTKIAWESKEGDSLAIDYEPTYSIPYRLILNDYKTQKMEWETAVTKVNNAFSNTPRYKSDVFSQLAQVSPHK